MDERIEKLGELLNDECYAKELFSMSIEDAQKNLADKGVIFTIEELADIARGICEAHQESREVSAEELDCVAGGRNQATVNQGKALGQKVRAPLIWLIKKLWGC